MLSKRLWFPDPSEAGEEGLLAVGGDLSVPRLQLAYEMGIFPWPLFGPEMLTWFSPDPRAILELGALHVSKSLAKVIRRNVFRVSFNRAFAQVIRHCSEATDERPSTWITSAMEAAYIRLHEAGTAQSVEVWEGSQLVGGLYGISLGGFFAGESMFTHRSNASKVALVALVERLRARGFGLLDVQQRTSHLVSMGATEIRRTEFLERMRTARQLDCSFR